MANAHYDRLNEIELGPGPAASSNQNLVPVQNETMIYRDASPSGREEKTNSTSRRKYVHRDRMRRIFEGENRRDKALNPYDSRLQDLVVQCSPGVLEGRSQLTWSRQPLRNRSPYMIRLSNWALSREYMSGKEPETNTASAMVRWVPACLALLFVMVVPVQVAAQPSNFGHFDNFLYKDWRYPHDARNQSENDPQRRLDSKRIQIRRQHTVERKPVPTKEMQRYNLPQSQLMPARRERLMEPTYLFFLDNNGDYDWWDVSEWRKKNPHQDVSYVFVSFYSHHFSKREYPLLEQIGFAAAIEVGATAFWISTACVCNLDEPDEQKRRTETEQTIWSMSDIIRGARSLAIAIRTVLPNENPNQNLLEWGERIWTMPELLLLTGDEKVLIYEKPGASRTGMQLKPKKRLNRKEVWHVVWADTSLSGQLIDHYEGSVILTPLELVGVALACLNPEVRKTTKVHLDGDMAYVIMGLLRQRPQIDASDSEFRAFARVSLANDSSMFLERMICLLPETKESPWWSLSDAWDASLWDIYPSIQMCGLGDNDTVIVDGARAATIRWNKFSPVLTLGKERMWRRLVRWTVRSMPPMVLMGLLLIIVGQILFPHSSSEYGSYPYSALKRQYSFGFSSSLDPITIIGLIFVVPSAVVLFLSPWLLRLIYRAKIYNSQPWFFGIEGYVNIRDLELLIFGSIEGRLNWSTSSSPLSRHSLDQDTSETGRLMRNENMFVGLDPVENDESIRRLVERAQSKESGLSDMKVFTLVDTYTMTVTLFEAVRPPVAVILCGAEGGMQRALLCSYDWTTSTLFRETVLRMETRVRDKMNTVSRLRLGLNRDDSRGPVDGYM